MGKFLSDDANALIGRLVAIDNSELVGPMFILRIPPATADIQKPASYMDLNLLDTSRKILQKRISVGDELKVIIHVATAAVEGGTRNEMTFQIQPRNKCQKISHCRRLFNGMMPINGKVTDNDGRKHLVVDAGIPIVVSLLEHKAAQTSTIKINSWVTLWPTPPTHGIILGKA